MSVEFNVYPNVKTKAHPRRISFNEYLREVKRHRCPYSKEDEQYDDYKENYVRALTVNAEFFKNPSYERFIKSTGYLFCEIDKKGDVEVLKKRFFNEHPFIMASYCSMSRTGVHYILKLSDQLTSIINVSGGRCIPELVGIISSRYFEGLLDVGAAKVTQYTSTGSDSFPLSREVIEPLHIEYTPSSAVKRLKANTSEKYDAIVEFSLVDELEYYNTPNHFRNLMEWYPDISQRFYWASILPTDPDLAGLLNWYDNLNPEKTFHKIEFQTNLSKHYFQPVSDKENSSQIVVITDEPVPTQRVSINQITKEGDRHNRLVLDACKLLSNNPMVSFKDLLEGVNFINTRCLQPPLLFYEVSGIAIYEFKRFHSGAMELNKPENKLAFFPTISILDKNEKSSIAQRAFYDYSRRKKVAVINKAVRQIIRSKLGRVTNQKIKEITGFSLPTIQRLRNKKSLKLT